MFVLEEPNKERLLIHLHGFASSVRSNKVNLLRELSLSTGAFSFFAMDMDYHTTTTTRVLSLLEALIVGFSKRYNHIVLSGSSHGAYVVLNFLRYREFPRNLKAAILLSPSYSTLALIIKEYGEEYCKVWLEGKEDLYIKECDTGMELAINREFAVDIIQRGYEIIKGQEVDFPQKPPVKLYVVHGTEDKVVPVEHSRLFTKRVESVYIEVEDDHRLDATFQRLLKEGFFEGSFLG
ncbi:alpha/beta hydrolase family protein [Thermocrinis minervae]|uniref:Uncharacterized protein n=1 Tax=Thermocrinis minervae TaxID=381751 RepID=A0A1M6QYM0_9AQUI|nr:YqiA/YcfP family alpha/beta fold hydrolase [Thermocrinis minervae]SHK25332.1 hypothetical protein SAMN05444391_0450 [Thermocrinis minervae]